MNGPLVDNRSRESISEPHDSKTIALPHYNGQHTNFISGYLIRIWGEGLRGSVVKCETRNPGVLGSSRTRYSGFNHGSVLRRDTSELWPNTGKT